MSRFKQRLVTSVGPSSINKCALVISIQCTQLRPAVVEFILIILLGLSHILSYHMSTLRLIAVWDGAGCDSRVMTMKYDGWLVSGVWGVTMSFTPSRTGVRELGVIQGERVTH